MEPFTFQPHLEKIKKIYPEKDSLYFRKWNFLALILKKFRKRKPRKFFLYFLKRKLFLYFWKWKPWKNPPYISGSETFLYFRKHKLLKSYIFVNGTFRAGKIKKAHSEKMPYISGNRTFKKLKKADACLKITNLSKTKGGKQRISQTSYRNIFAVVSF